MSWAAGTGYANKFATFWWPQPFLLIANKHIKKISQQMARFKWLAFFIVFFPLKWLRILEFYGGNSNFGLCVWVIYVCEKHIIDGTLNFLTSNLFQIFWWNYFNLVCIKLFTWLHCRNAIDQDFNNNSSIFFLLMAHCFTHFIY